MSKALKRIIQGALCLPIIICVGFLIHVMFGGEVTEQQAFAAWSLFVVGVFGVAAAVALEVTE